MSVALLKELTAKQDATQLREVLRDKALRSLYFFNKVVMSYAQMRDYLHLSLCDHIHQTAFNVRKRAYMWPRGYYKSSVGKGYALWSLIPCPEKDYLGNAYSEELKAIHDPNGPVLFVGESEAVASSKLRDIKWQLETNQLLQWLFPEIYPDVKSKWTESELLLKRSKTMDESSLMAIGVGGKITGFHFRKIIYDDIFGEKAAESQAEAEKVWSWFEVAPGLLQEPGTGEELILGTRWKHGKADLYGRIKEQLPYEVSESGRSTGFVFFEKAIVENDQPTFPDKYPWHTIKELEKRLGPYRFACNFMNAPNLPEGADFRPAWIKEYKISEDKKTIIPSDGSPSIAVGKLLRMSFYDVSAGGVSATAENAQVVAGMDSMKRIFCLVAWGKNCTIGEAVENWHRLNDKLHCYKNHYEYVGAQKVVEDLIKERNLGAIGPKGPICRTCGESHYRITPLPVKPPGGKSKEERIRMFAQEAFEQGRVYLHESMLKLKGQITSFPHGDLVDIFDAFAYLCNLLRPPMSDEELLDAQDEEELHKIPPASRVVSGSRHYGGYA